MNSAQQEIRDMFTSFQVNVLLTSQENKTFTKEQVIEKALLGDPAKTLILKEPCVLEVLGSYFNDNRVAVSSDHATTLVHDAWFALIRKIANKHNHVYDFSHNSFYNLRASLINAFQITERHFEMRKTRVKNNDEDFQEGIKRFNNSSHLQDTVKDLRYLREIAEKLYDTETIELCKKKIHALQAG